jgi:tetratricopeptide (TPR) repeat protein
VIASSSLATPVKLDAKTASKELREDERASLTGLVSAADTTPMIAAELLLMTALAGSSRQQTPPSGVPPACVEEIRNNPESPPGLMCRAGVEYLKFKQLKPGDPARDAHLDAAIALYRRLAEQQLGTSVRATALVSVAQLYLEGGRVQESIELWRSIVAMEPNQAFWRDGLSKALEKDGKSDEAEQALLDGIPVVFEPRDCYLALTNLYLARHQPAKATELLTRWARAEPNNLGAYTLLTWYYWQRVRVDVSQMPPNELDELVDGGSAAAERALETSPRDGTSARFLNAFLRLRAALTSDPGARETLTARAARVRREADDMSEPLPLPKLPGRR